MKIPLKLKKDELYELVIMLETLLNGHVCESRTEAIVVALVLQFYQKLKQKSILLEKANTTIQVPPETAMAFVEFFETALYNNTSYGGIIVSKILNNYDTKTTHLF